MLLMQVGHYSWKPITQWPIFDKSHYGSVVMVYCQTFNIRRTLVGNEIVDHSDVVGAAPIGAAPTASSF